MSLPAKKIETPEPIPAPFMAIAEAAAMLGLHVDHLGRLCRDRYAAAGLARKIDGRWVVHPNADPRLRGLETWHTRDVRQLAELRREGVPDKQVRLAERKRDIVLGFARFEGRAHGDEAQRREYINSLLAGKAIPCDGIKRLTPRTLRLWHDLYRQSGNAGGLRALVRRLPARRGEQMIGRAAWEMFLHVRHCGTGITVAAAYDQVFGYIREQRLTENPEWTWPSLRTIQNHYKTRTPQPLRVLVDEGPHRFRAKCLPKVARSYGDLEAGQCFCGDERTLDIMCRVAGDRAWRRIRPKLTAWTDVRSRMFVGWYIGERSNSDTILSSFKAACLLAETIPTEVIIDNGLDYKAVGGKSRNRRWDAWDSSRIQTAFERLETEAHYTIVRHPWSKIIESLFRAVKDNFDRFMPSFWGGDPTERPWDAERWTKTHLLELPTLDEVREAFAEFLAAYHERPLRGDSVLGLSPRQAMRQFYTTEPRAVNEGLLDLACCRLHGPVKVGRDGVRHQGLQYGKWDRRVWGMQGQQVFIALDPVQAEYITLCQADGTPICRAHVDRNRGVTRDEVREAIAFQRRCEKDVKKAVQARGYLLKTRSGQIAQRQKLAAQARQIPDDQLPPAPKPERIRVVRPDIAAGAERVKQAAGAEAMRRLTASNRAAAEVNAAAVSRFVDFARFASITEEEETPSVSRRVVDYARLGDRKGFDE